jgi:hypothetical protein
MNQQKRNYIVKRIHNVVQAKERCLCNEQHTEQHRIQQKWIGKVTADVQQGKLKPKKKVKIERRIYSIGNLGLRDFFDLTPYHIGLEKEDCERAKKYNKVLDALRAEEQKLEDEIWLGDESKALEMLRDFEKKHQ